MRGVDIALLPLLRTARQQDHQRLAIATEINPVARPEIDPIFQHTSTDSLDAGKIALFHACNGPRDFGARNRFQVREPVRCGRIKPKA